MAAGAGVALALVLAGQAPASAATIDPECLVRITERDVEAHATWQDADSGSYPDAGEQFLITPGQGPVPRVDLDGYEAALQEQILGLYEVCGTGVSATVTLERADGRGVLPELSSARLSASLSSS